MMQFRILGPMEVLVDGEVATVGGPRQRAVLVRLLIDRGRVVSAGRIVEDVWDGRPPESAPKLLHKYVCELRKSLPGLPLRTSGGGYVLEVAADDVDAGRFERLVDAGDHAAALALWRGPPLADLPDIACVAIERARLEELHLFAIESRIAGELDAGRHGPAIAELTELVDAHPLRERLTCLLMLALYRSGRQVEALRACERHRRHLAEEIGVAPAEQVRQLEQAILVHDARLELAQQSTATPPGVRGNLPMSLTTFVGRATELEQLEQAIAANRLVTLTGPGGVGKTRLALALGARLASRYPGGVWTVDLAGVDQSDLGTALASALDIDVRHASTDTERIVTAIAHRPEGLIVLDNCEHLVEAVAKVAAALLGTADKPRVLATSRRPLGVDGEFARPVHPLPHGDAQRLFADRARLTGAGDDEISSERVRQICSRLDGLPLAIELAASQLRVMDIDDIVTRLDDHLSFRRPTAEVSPRQRTLGEMVQWSYGLLAPSARTTFARLGVFASSLTLPAAEQVGADRDADRPTVLEDITTLIDHSLLVREHAAPNSTRYRLLETLRLFALQRLAELGQEPSARRAHAEHFLALALGSRTELLGPHEQTWRDRLEADEANLHAAIGWAANHDPVLALRLATALWPYWEVRWRERHGVALLDRLLERDVDAPADVRAWALTAHAAMSGNAGEARLTLPRSLAAVDAQRGTGDELGLAEALAALGMAFGNQGRLDEADHALAEGLEIARRLGDLQVTARLLDRAGFVAGRRGDHATAATINREELSVMSALGSRRGEATALRHLAISLRHLGEVDEAAALCHRALDIWRELDDPAATAHVQTTLADISRTAGDLAAAVATYHAALAQLRAIGDRRCTASTYKNLATIAVLQGERDQAAALFRDGLRLRHELGDEAGLAEILEGLASIESAAGNDRQAAVLLGAASSVRERTGSSALGTEAEQARNLLELAADRIGDDAVEAAFAHASALSVAEIVGLALRADTGAVASAAASS
jgi:predicted ATPase/DNA-binding SARP family transcriptional activator